jgi:hypothetical protein
MNNENQRITRTGDTAARNAANTTTTGDTTATGDTL